MIHFLTQANSPRPLANQEKRQAKLSKTEPLLFYLFADDADLYDRVDAAFYLVSTGKYLLQGVSSIELKHTFCAVW